MRMIVLFAGAMAVVALVFRWRYRILNTILAIGILRKFAVQLSMSSPSIRRKFIPWMFQGKSN
ncbi:MULTISPECIES: hypothetical protein [Clostridia]|uniref:hypothetical protein n=1 Tax=Clostridia TaxID=186801 RepID=UPI000EA105AB|nr:MULTISPECIES: hypothetical protein [Clostridia]NBJ68524.1 hypothetical protein [Roseburia sp. 1XD42-34]RKI80787.1 hypothetical protein D7V87_04520 [Clostridium sp. 1xD42-85]